MPAASQEQAAARREEIVGACAELYRELPFKKITLGLIGARTTFTRTSIYNYFRTKEEIFLALLEREYAAWADDLDALSRAAFPAAEFPVRFAVLLERRGCMLKLMAMNLYDMEAGSRLENLVAFKREYNRSMQAVARCLHAHCPSVTEEDVQQFIYAFYPFLFGVYPYTEAGEKQLRAMDIAGVVYRRQTVTEITASLVGKLLSSYQNQRNDHKKEKDHDSV